MVASADAEAIAAIVSNPRALSLDFRVGLVHIHAPLFLQVADALRSGELIVIRSSATLHDFSAAAAYLPHIVGMVVGDSGVRAAPGNKNAHVEIHEAVHAACDLQHLYGVRALHEEVAAFLAQIAYIYVGEHDEKLAEALALQRRGASNAVEELMAGAMEVVMRYGLHKHRGVRISARDLVTLSELLRREPAYEAYPKLMPRSGGCGLGCSVRRFALHRVRAHR